MQLRREEVRERSWTLKHAMGLRIRPQKLTGVSGQELKKACRRWVQRQTTDLGRLGIAQGCLGSHKEGGGKLWED